MQTVLIALLRFYKVAVSPMLGNRCRFYPSCSDYAREAIQYHGAARGTYLAARRICRCHPFSAGLSPKQRNLVEELITEFDGGTQPATDATPEPEDASRDKNPPKSE